MNNKEFKIVKKNRKYFAALLLNKSSEYKCKIEIDDNSKDLEVGSTISLLVEDTSVKTKYGTDLKFKLAASLNKQASEEIVTLKHFRFNSDLVEKCRKLGGKWDKESESWVFNSIVEDKVEELDELYSSDLKNYEIKFHESAFYDKKLHLAGYDLVVAKGRDEGVYTIEDTAIIDEEKIYSGGSRKNYGVKFEEGAVLRVKLPDLIAKDIKSEEFEIKEI